MTSTDIAKSELVYNGEIIHAKAEMLSLTDMWKAAGADPSKQPAKWRDQDGTKEFVAHLTNSVLLQGEDKLYKTTRGATAGTWAHWHIALSYARYLSPEFHVLCNEWCRERMEGKAIAISTVPAELSEMIERNFGISRMLSHKVTENEKALMSMMSMMTALLAQVQPGQPILIRHGKTAGQILKMAGIAPVKGLAAWFGNRLAAFGCRIEHNGCAEMGMTKARLFDPDKAQFYLDNGGRSVVMQKVSERQGQKTLRLVPNPSLPVPQAATKGLHSMDTL